MNTQKVLGKSIRRARRLADITQCQLASALDVSQAAVSDWERGRRLLLNSLSYPSPHN